MANIPAICRRCKFVMESPFNIEFVHRATLKNNTVSPCPRCGGIADVLEGTFELTEGIIKAISAPAASRFVLRQLENLSKQVINEAVELEQFELEAKRNPVVKEILDLLPKDRKEKIGLLKFVGQVALTVIGLTSIANITFNTGDVIQNIYYQEQQELEQSNELPKDEIKQEYQGTNVIEVDFRKNRN